MKMYLVGGAVRDEIMGLRSKDLDYSVVLDEQDRWIQGSAFYSDPFQVMVLHLMRMGYKIFLETPEHLTVRAQTPDRKETADFVLARKEGAYTDGRRPDSVEVGTLQDDLARRDFTMNAIAKSVETDSFGVTRILYIDPFDGEQDIEARTIRAVGDPYNRLLEDALRAVRALRFSVTKGFAIDSFLAFAMKDDEVLAAIENNISDERIDIELSKMFRFDTIASLRALEQFPALTEAMFSGRVSLDSTMKTKGRNVPQPPAEVEKPPYRCF